MKLSEEIALAAEKLAGCATELQQVERLKKQLKAYKDTQEDLLDEISTLKHQLHSAKTTADLLEGANRQLQQRIEPRHEILLNGYRYHLDDHYKRRTTKDV